MDTSRARKIQSSTSKRKDERRRRAHLPHRGHRPHRPKEKIRDDLEGWKESIATTLLVQAARRPSR